MTYLAGEAPVWQERHRALAVGLAAAFLGNGGQESGTLLQLSAEKASAANLKPVLLEMKTQVIAGLKQHTSEPKQQDNGLLICKWQGPCVNSWGGG